MNTSPFPSIVAFVLLTTPLALAADPADLERELAALGPSAEERLAQVAPTRTETRAMRKIVNSWNAHQLAGDAAVRRANNRDRLLKRFGLKALPVLFDALESNSHWERSVAAESIVILLKRDEELVRWLCFHHDVPGKLIDTLGKGPNPERVAVAKSVHAQLKVILQQKALSERQRAFASQRWWSDEDLPRYEELLRREWREVWKVKQREWEREQARLRHRRLELKAQLKE